jgi:hypothetical protein
MSRQVSPHFPETDARELSEDEVRFLLANDSKLVFISHSHGYAVIGDKSVRVPRGIVKSLQSKHLIQSTFIDDEAVYIMDTPIECQRRMEESSKERMDKRKRITKELADDLLYALESGGREKFEKEVERFSDENFYL